MKTTRRVPLKKENSTDNYYKDSLKPRPISFSPKKNTTSQSRIPLPKIPKTKPENINIIQDDLDQVEKEIEYKLRLKLKPEYIQRYHTLQNKYDDEIDKSSVPLNKSFINNLINLFSTKQHTQYINKNVNQSPIEEDEEFDSYEYEYEYEYEEINTNKNNEIETSEIIRLKKEIENQKHKQESLNNELEKNNEIIQKIKSNIAESLDRQKNLQNEQQSISNQIGEAYARNSNLFLELTAMKEQKQYEIQFNELPDSFDGGQDQIEIRIPEQIAQGNHPDTSKIGSKVPTRKYSEPTSATTQSQSYINSFENSSQPLINLSESTDSEEDHMLLYMNQSSNANSNNNIEVDSLDEDSLENNDNNGLSDNIEEEEKDDIEINVDTKTEYNWHVEDYIMTDEEVLTYTTKYEEQKQFTLETMMETQEESTTIVETFEMKPNEFYIEEEEEENDYLENEEDTNDNENRNLTDNNENEQNDDDLNSNGLPKELFRSPYRIKIPIRPPKK